MTAAYAGVWALQRSIIDNDRATVLVCAGTATLELRDGTLAYDEAVSFLLADKTIRATRAYRFASAGDTIVATFADGKPFFTLRLSSDGTGTAFHRCRDDRYALTLTLSEAAAWQTQWQVSGTKRLTITTEYTRLTSPAE